VGLIGKVVLGISGIIGTIAIAATARLVADDAKEWSPIAVSWLLRRAVSKLPSARQERLTEEWRRYIQELPGHSAKVIAALGLQIASNRIRHQERRVERAKRIPEFEQLLSLRGTSLRIGIGGGRNRSPAGNTHRDSVAVRWAPRTVGCIPALPHLGAGSSVLPAVQPTPRVCSPTLREYAS
jgi:hypothetical protein